MWRELKVNLALGVSFAAGSLIFGFWGGLIFFAVVGCAVWLRERKIKKATAIDGGSISKNESLVADANISAAIDERVTVQKRNFKIALWVAGLTMLTIDFGLCIWFGQLIIHNSVPSYLDSEYLVKLVELLNPLFVHANKDAYFNSAIFDRPNAYLIWHYYRAILLTSTVLLCLLIFFTAAFLGFGRCFPKLIEFPVVFNNEKLGERSLTSYILFAQFILCFYPFALEGEDEGLYYSGTLGQALYEKPIALANWALVTQFLVLAAIFNIMTEISLYKSQKRKMKCPPN